MSTVRNWMRLLAFISLSLFLLSSRSVAEPSEIISPSDATTSTVQNPTKLANTDTEIAILRARLEEQQGFQDQIISTVYWSLGVITTLSVALVGFGWFANFKMYDREKAAMLAGFSAEITEEIQKVSESLKSDVNTRFSSEVKGLDDLSRSLAEEILAEAHKEISKIEMDISRRILSAEHAITKILKALDTLKLRDMKEERLRWIQKDIPRNALSDSTSILELSNKISDNYLISNALDLIIEDINRIEVKNKKPIDSYLVGRLVKCLDEVQGDHAHAAAGLIEKTKKLQDT